MKPMPGAGLALPIAEAMKQLAAAEAEAISTLKKVQAKCDHQIVSEMPWRAGNYFGSRAAHRICNHCRLIEEGSHWSGGSVWSRHDYGEADLGNTPGRIVLPIDSDEFWKMRTEGGMGLLGGAA